MKLERRPTLMFRDVFAQAIPVADQRDLLHSVQDDFISRSAAGLPLNLPFADLEPFFATDSTSLHPAVSVVDINRDGWDDLYVMTRWHKNRLFINQHDGTFVNQAAEYGLDIDRTSCALFADFDNDGDSDAFLGRSYSDSLLMINEGGKFVDRTREKIKQPLPGFVTSISAADYNNDGLLDVYLSTYVSIGATVQTVENAANFMPLNEAKRMLTWFKKATPADIWLDRPGPPSRLLVNCGDSCFEPSEAMPDVWRNTFQATWSDYDQCEAMEWAPRGETMTTTAGRICTFQTCTARLAKESSGKSPMRWMQGTCCLPTAIGCSKTRPALVWILSQVTTKGRFP